MVASIRNIPSFKMALFDERNFAICLNELYIYLDDYVNFFQPVLKLVLKTRDGSRVTKRYDRAKTPLLNSYTRRHITAAPHQYCFIFKYYMFYPLKTTSSIQKTCSHAI
jgi:hypothetical protein